MINKMNTMFMGIYLSHCYGMHNVQAVMKYT